MRYMLCAIALLLTACATPNDLGRQALSRGDLPGAEREFTQAIRHGDASAWNSLGVVYERQNRLRAAVAAYTMGARYGDPTAIENLSHNNLPIPKADLAATRPSSTDGLAAALDAFNRGYSGGMNCTSWGWDDLKRITCH